MMDKPDTDPESLSRRTAIKLEPWARWVSGAVGVLGAAAGTLAVFTRDVEAGPVALIFVGALLLIIALSGRLPFRLKIGDNEAEFSEEVVESFKRIIREAPKVDRELSDAGATLKTLAAGRIEPSADRIASISPRVEVLSSDVEKVSNTVGSARVPPQGLLQLAKWSMLRHQWDRAAKYFDQYVQQVPGDWEVQFSRGVAHANSRAGRESDFAALQAYDAALAWRPDSLDQNLFARLLIYRGAIKKRLGRLLEAEADVTLGRQQAKADYERLDATYNLAAIHAMKGEREATLAEILALKNLGGIRLVKGHLDDYFKDFRNDPEFRRIID